MYWESPLRPVLAPAERNTHHRPGRSGEKQKISTADEKMTVDVPKRAIGQFVTLCNPRLKAYLSSVTAAS